MAGIKFAVVILIVITCLDVSSLFAIENPNTPIIYSNGSGKIEVFWFYPGLHEDTLGNTSHNPNILLSPGSQDVQNAVFTRFEVYPPVFVEEESCFLRGGAYETIDSEGFFPPVRMALKCRDKSGIWIDRAYEFKRLHSSQADGAMIVLKTDTAIKEYFEIWPVFKLSPGYPQSPYFGGYEGDCYLEQYVCAMADSNYVMKSVEGTFISGVTLRSWCGTEISVKSDLRFNLLFGNDSLSIDSKSEILGSAGVDSLRLAIDPAHAGFIAIKVEVNDESSISPSVPYHPNRKAPLEFQYSQADLLYTIGDSHLGEFQIRNVGSEPLDISLYYDERTYTFSPGSLTIQPGALAAISAYYKQQSLPEAERNSFIILDCGEEHYPVRYEFKVSEGIPTAIDEDHSMVVPCLFEVSPAFPNPFNSSVRFGIVSESVGQVDVSIFNLLGQEVMAYGLPVSGSESVAWDGKDFSGEECATGFYLFRFRQGDISIVRKALLIK